MSYRFFCFGGWGCWCLFAFAASGILANVLKAGDSLTPTPQPPSLRACWVYVNMVTCERGYQNAGVVPVVDTECGPCQREANLQIVCRNPIRRNIFESRLQQQAPQVQRVGSGMSDKGEAVLYCGEGWYCNTLCEKRADTLEPICTKLVAFDTILRFRILDGDCSSTSPEQPIAPPTSSAK